MLCARATVSRRVVFSVRRLRRDDAMCARFRANQQEDERVAASRRCCHRCCCYGYGCMVGAAGTSGQARRHSRAPRGGGTTNEARARSSVPLALLSFLWGAPPTVSKIRAKRTDLERSPIRVERAAHRAAKPDVCVWNRSASSPESVRRAFAKKNGWNGQPGRGSARLIDTDPSAVVSINGFAHCSHCLDDADRDRSLALLHSEKR